MSRVLCNISPEESPNAVLSRELTKYCTGQFKDLETLRTQGTEIQKNLCYCHMKEEQYNNFQESLFEAFPGFSGLGFNKYCLVPGCASSIYKKVNIRDEVCQVPDCLNITSFTNQGTIDRSWIEITQTTGQCAGLVGGEPISEPEPGPEPEPTGVNIWLIVGSTNCNRNYSNNPCYKET